MRSSLSRLVFQALHTSVFFGLKAASGVLVILVLAKNLAPAEFGVYSLVRSLVAVGVYVLGLEVYTYLQRHVPGRPKAEGLSLFMQVFSWESTIALLAVTGVLAAGLDRRLAETLNIGEYANAYRVGFGILLATLVAREVFRLFLAFRMIEHSNTIGFLNANLWVLALTALWLVGGDVTLESVLIAWTCGALLALGYGVWAIHRVFGIGAAWRAYVAGLSRPSTPFFRSVLGFSLPVFLSTVALQLMTLVDSYLLSYFHRAEAVGVYGLYNGLMNLNVVMFVLIVSDVLAPYATANLNRGEDVLGWWLVGRIMTYSVVVCFALAGVVVALSDEIVAIVARPEYLEGDGMVPYLLATAVLNVLYTTTNYVLFLEGRTRTMASIALAGLGVNALANVALIPKMGYLGAVWAGTLSWGVLFGLTTWQASWQRLRQLALRDVARVGLAAVTAAGAAAGLGAVARGNGGAAWNLASAAVFCVAFAFALVGFGVLRWSELRTLRVAVR